MADAETCREEEPMGGLDNGEGYTGDAEPQQYSPFTGGLLTCMKIGRITTGRTFCSRGGRGRARCIICECHGIEWNGRMVMSR